MTKPSCLPSCKNCLLRLGPMRLLAVRTQALDTEPDKLGPCAHMMYHLLPTGSSLVGRENMSSRCLLLSHVIQPFGPTVNDCLASLTTLHLYVCSSGYLPLSD